MLTIEERIDGKNNITHLKLISFENGIIYIDILKLPFCKAAVLPVVRVLGGDFERREG